MTTAPITASEGTTTAEVHLDHGHHPDLRMFGVATFLVADGMTFAGFFAAYLTFRAVNPLPEGPPMSSSCSCPPSTPPCWW